MKKNFTLVCDYFYTIFSIPIIICDGDGNILITAPEFPSDIISPTYLKQINQYIDSSNQTRHHIYHCDPCFLGTVIDIGNNLFVHLGLISEVQYKVHETFKGIKEFINPAHIQDYIVTLMNTPCVRYQKLYIMANFIRYLFTDELRIPEWELNVQFTDADFQKQMYQYADTHELAQHHVPIHTERLILQAFENADFKTMIKEAYKINGFAGRMSMNDIQQKRYDFVATTTLLSRSAINAGVPEEEALSLCDHFCLKMDRCNSIAHITSLLKVMVEDFCTRVAKYKSIQTHSMETKKCCNYINQHLYEPISIDQLSKHANLCSKRLSERFKKEMGISIHTYINNLRIEEAKVMLSNSEIPIIEISNILQYSSQSYFTVKFKETCNMTPQKWRNLYSTGKEIH